MSLRSAYYRHRAEECERAAQNVHDSHFKSLYLGLMNEWRVLARQIETFDLDGFHFDEAESASNLPNMSARFHRSMHS